MDESSSPDHKSHSPPSHPGLCKVESNPGSFNSRLIAEKDFAEGDIICDLQGLIKSPKAYSSVQCGTETDDHIELNSDLVYMNHSCEPNVYVDLSPDQEWKIRAARIIIAGDALCFFYPSTEWDMAQPFTCNCNAPTCLEVIKGAKFLTPEELSRRGFINRHIWILKQRQMAL